MLRLLGLRSWIGLTAVLIAAAGLYAMQDRLAGWWSSGTALWSSTQDENDWRQRELLFLKQAYDRLEAERRQAGGNSPMSQRNEQQAILRRIQETAAPIRGKVPPEIAALLPGQPTAEAGKPEPPALEAAKTEPAKLEQAAVEPTKPEQAAVEPTKPERAVVEPAKPERAVVEPAKPERAPVEPAKPEPALPAVAAVPSPRPAAEPNEPRAGSAPFPRLDPDMSALSRDPELVRLWERVSMLRARPPKPAESAAKPADAAAKSAVEAVALPKQ